MLLAKWQLWIELDEGSLLNKEKEGDHPHERFVLLMRVAGICIIDRYRPNYIINNIIFMCGNVIKCILIEQ